MDDFEEFREFFYPVAHADIDWSRGYEILNTELEKILTEAEVGKGFTEILVKVYRKNGEQRYVLVHIKVISDYEADLPERIYLYNSVVYLHYRKPVASMAILGDDRPNWKPQQFVSTILESRISLSYKVVKLLDYQNQYSELERSTNPFAAMVGDGSGPSSDNNALAFAFPFVVNALAFADCHRTESDKNLPLAITAGAKLGDINKDKMRGDRLSSYLSTISLRYHLGQ